MHVCTKKNCSIVRICSVRFVCSETSSVQLLRIVKYTKAGFLFKAVYGPPLRPDFLCYLLINKFYRLSIRLPRTVLKMMLGN